MGFFQSASGSDGPTTSTISPPGSWLGLIGPTGAPGLTSEVRVGASLPGRVPSNGTGLSSPGEILGVGTGISSSSWMEGLNKSYVNTPGGGGSWLDPSRART
jgi:hypothetical protein